ncbi:MAG: histidine kinase [Bacteroides sp.]|nr:histidine kinase [Bacteroides sp.]
MLLAQFVLEYYAYQAMEIFPEPTYDLDDKLILVFDFLGNYFLNLIAFIGCSVTLLFRYWISDSQRAGQLASEQLKTEVEYLKEQVDPNFLFNTLNRIGRLGEIDPSQASAMLLIFSKLLRYQLYDCRRQEVFLTSEIKFLHDYLCLEQLYYEKMEFTITLEGDVASVLVPPLLFIPFVREQIKGIEKRDTYATFLLHFNANDQTLQFTTTGDTQIKSFSPDFRFITKRLALLFGNNYNLQYLSPPFIIPEGHCLRLSLPQTDQL